MKRFLFLLLLVCSSWQISYAQGWVMRVSVNATTSLADCWVDKINSMTLSYRGQTSTISAAPFQHTFLLNDWVAGHSLEITGTYKICCSSGGMGAGTFCLSSSPFSATFTINMSGTCESVSYINGNVRATVTVYPRIATPFESSTTLEKCNNNIKLNVSTCSITVNNHIWEVSNSVSGPWFVLTDKTTASITVTAEDLYRIGFSSKYGARYVKVSDAGRSGRTSEALLFNVHTPAPTISFSNIKDPTCNNGTDGSIQVNITSPDVVVVNKFVITTFEPTSRLMIDQADGKSSPYTVTDLSTQNLVTLIFAATKSFLVRVENKPDESKYGNCWIELTTPVINNPSRVIATPTSTKHNGYEVKCKDGRTGEITVTASGGTPGYKNYLWNTGATTPTINGLPAGTYSVSLKDTNDCPANASITIAEPPSAVTASIVSVNKGIFNERDISCRDKTDGLLRATGLGGVGGYSYQWTGGPATADYPNVGVNSYTVTVTDANSCADTENYAVVNPPAIDFVLEQQTAIDCAGASTGAVRLKDFSLSNAIGSTTYTWSTGESTSFVDNKPAGMYTLTVTDAQSCSTSKSFSLIDPAAYTVSITHDSNYNGSKISCNGEADGALRAIVRDHLDDSQTPNSYSWYRTSDLTTEIGSGPTQEDLNEGSYTVIVDYNSGCKAQDAYFLADPDPLSPTINPTSDYNDLVVKCTGDLNGSISAGRSGGTGAHTFVWNDAGSTTGPDLTSIGAGTYIVTATDLNGCTGSNSYTVVDPSPVTPTIAALSNYNSFVIKCFGESNGSLRASATGGTGGVEYTYAWNTGTIGTDIVGLSAGTYTVTATDKNGCSGIKSMSIENPEKVVAMASVVSDYNGFDISCNGASNGRLLAIPLGGTNTFTYLWNNGSTSISPSGLAQGTYSVTVTDANGCTEVASTTLYQPDPVIAAIEEFSNYNGFGVRCSGSDEGFIKIGATGGTDSFTYEWLGESETSNTLSSVRAGTYQITVRDSNGCPSNISHTITEPTLLTLFTTNKNHVKCFGTSTGELEVSAAGGIANYEYSLDNVNWQVSNQFSGLLAQNYTVYARDLNLCVIPLAESITEPAELVISFTDIEPAFCADPRGKAKAEIIGGVGAYRYEWKNSSGTVISSTNNISNVAAGAYLLTSQDGNDCPVLKTVAIASTDGPQLIVKETVEAKCSYSSDGSALLEVVAGDGPFTYQWPDGQTTSMGSSLAKGNYVVEVKDRNNCVSTKEVAITAPDVLEIEILESLSPACFGDCNGMIKVTNTGGTGLVVFNWGASVGDVLSGICKGSYAVQATDANGCIANRSFIVREPDPLELKLVDRRLPKCFGGCDGMMAVEATGGNGSYDYEWNTGSRLAIADGICAGNHTVSLTDLRGCTAERTYSLGQPERLNIRLLANQQPDCHDGCNGKLEVDATGGVGTYSYQWSTGTSTALAEDICPGDYTVSVVDVNACISNATYTVNNPPALIVDLGGSITLCVGQTHVLDVGNTWSSYLWRSNTGLSSTYSSVTITEPGQYWVEVQNNLGCIAQDTFLLETSLDLLQASFLMPKETMVGDTVVIIDISWPLPDRIEWGLPPEMNKMLDMGDVIYGKFASPGEYSVLLNTHLGQCFDAIGKMITVLENTSTDPEDDLGFKEFVKEFAMYPNPTQGNFSVRVEIEESSPITLSVWSSLSGRVLKQVKLEGNETYNPDIIMDSLIPGAYVLRLDHAKGRKYIHFIVH